MPTPEQIEDMFTYHAPTADQIPKYETVRAAAKEFARVICENSPASADQSAALRLLRQCVYSVNGSIALGGKF